MTDEIIQELWQAKDAIAAEHNHNVKSLVEHLRKEQKTSSVSVVNIHDKRQAEKSKNK